MGTYRRDNLVFDDGSSRLYSGLNTHSFAPVTLLERYHQDSESAQKLIRISENFSQLQEVPGLLRVLDRYWYAQDNAFFSVVVYEPITRTLRQEIETRRQSGEKWEDVALRTAMVGLMEAVEATHSLNICHGTLSDTSVFLLPSGNLKIGKFEQSHWSFGEHCVETEGLKPFLSDETLEYLRDSSSTFDWQQADAYSLGVIFLAMASLGDIAFLWKMQRTKHEEVILQLNYRYAFIEVLTGLLTDALGERMTLKKAIALLAQESLFQEEQQGAIVVEKVVSGKDTDREEKEETYTCSFCSEPTGRISAIGYICVNPNCSTNSSSPAETEHMFCPMCSQKFNPAMPWSSPLVTGEQQGLVSLVCSYPCLEKLVSMGERRKCPYCSATPPKDCSWKARHTEVPEDQLLDICSFACYIVHGQMIGDDKQWGQACLQCGKVTKSGNQHKVIQLDCSPEHVFCSYKCMKVFSKGHGHTEVLCPICALPFNFEAVRKVVKNRKEGTKCACCQALAPVVELSCKHRCCLQCISTNQESGLQKCPLKDCRHMEELRSQ